MSNARCFSWFEDLQFHCTKAPLEDDILNSDEVMVELSGGPLDGLVFPAPLALILSAHTISIRPTMENCTLPIERQGGLYKKLRKAFYKMDGIYGKFSGDGGE